MIRTLKEALHDQIHSSGVPLKIQAEEIGVSYSYLANSANPDLDEFRLALRYLAPLCRVTGRFDALDHIENSLNRVAFSIPTKTPTNKSLHTDLAACFKEFGEFGQTAAQALADNHITRCEAKEIEKELIDLVSQAMGFLRSVQEAAGR